mmetsp:Transcript_10717/g.27805  ORF Transcript_10717/g.27805 Transcript_10717/m.27805 type:complete len:253 (-) Transcript_10717:2664-3422(-)
MPFSSSMIWAEIFLWLRATDRRGRPSATLRSLVRTRWARRSILSRELFMGLLLLAFLAADIFALITDTLAFVWLRRTEFAEFGSNLANRLFVCTRDDDLGWLRRFQLDAVRSLEDHIVREAECELEIGTLHLGTITNANQFQRLRITIRNAFDHVRCAGTSGAPLRTGLGIKGFSEGWQATTPSLFSLDTVICSLHEIFARRNGQLVVLELWRDQLRQDQRKLTLGAFCLDRLTFDRDGRAIRNFDREFTNT